MNNRELTELLYRNMEHLTVLQAVYNLLIALLCTIIIYLVYFFTSKESKPTAVFAKTIFIVSLVTSLLIMLIGSNLALSLGMVGALSIIRFRAAVKDSRDAAFIFYAIAAGMISALGVYAIALIGTLFIGSVVVIFSFINIESRTYVLTVRSCSSGSQIEDEIKRVIGKRYNMIAISSKYNPDSNSSATETVYEIGLKFGVDELCERISKIEGVVSVNALLRED